MKEEKITVILPTYNVDETLEETIKGILKQEYGSEIKIMAIDGGSSDQTIDIVKRYEKENDNLEFVDGEDLNGYAAQMNKGIELAETELICFVNADCVPKGKDWMSKLVEALNPEEDIVGAQPRNIIPEELVENSSLPYRLFYGSRKPHEVDEIEPGPFNFQPNGYVCLKSVLEEVGMLDGETYRSAGEDYDLALRVQKLGYKSALVPTDLLHYHGKGEDFGYRDYLWKHMQQSEGQGVIMRKYPLDKHDKLWNEMTKSGLYASAFIPYVNLLTIPLIVAYLAIFTYSKREVLSPKEMLITPLIKIGGDMFNIAGFYKGLIRGKQGTIPISLRSS